VQTPAPQTAFTFGSQDSKRAVNPIRPDVSELDKNSLRARGAQSPFWLFSIGRAKPLRIQRQPGPRHGTIVRPSNPDFSNKLHKQKLERYIGAQNGFETTPPRREKPMADWKDDLQIYEAGQKWAKL
jgi:hypothetical protein